MAKITLRELHRRLSSLNLEEVAGAALQKRGTDATNMLREQLYSGEKGDGRKIGEYRSVDYAEFKHEINPLPGPRNVDLFLTGAYYSRFEQVS